MMNEEIVIDTLAILGERCQRCETAQSELPHSCPFVSDIYDDPHSECNCCLDCVQDCANDI